MKNEWPGIFLSVDRDPSRLWNMDETGLFWCALKVTRNSIKPILNTTLPNTGGVSADQSAQLMAAIAGKQMKPDNKLPEFKAEIAESHEPTATSAGRKVQANKTHLSSKRKATKNSIKIIQRSTKPSTRSK